MEKAAATTDVTQQATVSPVQAVSEVSGLGRSVLKIQEKKQIAHVMFSAVCANLYLHSCTYFPQHLPRWQIPTSVIIYRDRLFTCSLQGDQR